MTVLTTHNLGKHYGAQDVFEGLTLSVNQGDRIALVGPNGEGKTTLLRILAGLEQPSAGAVHTAKGLKLGYLEQHPSLISTGGTLWELALSAFAELRQQEAALHDLAAALAAETGEPRHQQLLEQYGEAEARFEHAGGYTYEQTTEQVLTGLAFKREDFGMPLTKLSGGQQSRAHLAHLLLKQPDLLLLDEPTNHLDLASVEWLENYLKSWPGAIIAVSHDRYFLDEVATRVWEMLFGKIEGYRGNYSHYVQQRQERFERRQKEYQAQQEFIAKEEEFIRRNLAGQRTREAQGRRTRLERMNKLDRPSEHKTLKLSLQTTLRSGDLVLATHELVVGYPDGPPLFTCPDLEIRRGQRIALLGPNGAGKTTFIKTILGQVKPKTGAIRFGAGVEIGYFAQTQASLKLDATILDEILSVQNLPIGEARNYLGRFLFSGDDVFKPIGALSGGERSRVALAKLTLTGSNFLILDEPTNHLDISSQENLEQVLNDFSGTILLVSHDRYFVDALATHTWALEPDNKSVTVVEGGYSDYLAEREAQKSAVNNATNGSAPKSTSQTSREQSKAEKRANEKKARQIAEIESMIAATEAHLAELARQLEAASQTQDIAQLQQLGQDYQTTEAKLEELLTQWTELETA
ncbi:MAG: ABC transporter ATP-binding protein [Anaerolineae bacterium]|nr:ABC-F family ATP-binding cassette domain-containing protein [Anaerolineales bacterium]MCQ3975134.1 ABC transporter ATP-binding protein [Anaerolineae bacterium]